MTTGWGSLRRGRVVDLDGEGREKKRAAKVMAVMRDMAEMRLRTRVGLLEEVEAVVLLRSGSSPSSSCLLLSMFLF